MRERRRLRPHSRSQTYIGYTRLMSRTMTSIHTHTTNLHRRGREGRFESDPCPTTRGSTVGARTKTRANEDARSRLAHARLTLECPLQYLHLVEITRACIASGPPGVPLRARVHTLSSPLRHDPHVTTGQLIHLHRRVKIHKQQSFGLRSWLIRFLSLRCESGGAFARRSAARTRCAPLSHRLNH